jgi:NitT/TauT family transport system substrate-binding protein
VRLSLKATLIICFLTVSSARDSRATTVNVAVPSYSMSLIAFATAKEQGYYRQEGLDVNFILMTAPLASRALIGGNVEFATVGGSALTGILAGAPMRLLFSSFNRAVFWLYGKPDIRDVKELKGKRIGISAVGSGPDSMLRDLLKAHGLDGAKDVLILATGVDSNRYAALATGAVDAVLLSTPYNFVAEEAGFRELARIIHG